MKLFLVELLYYSFSSLYTYVLIFFIFFIIIFWMIKIFFYSAGSKQMLELSKTKEENKSLVIVENGLHDLITNEMILLTSKSIIWIEKQLIHNAINK